MAVCSVLRCAQQAAHVFPVNKADAPLLEVSVCSQHQSQLDAGAAWNWNFDHGELLMGDDAMPRLARWGIDSGAGGSELGEGHTLRLELDRGGEVDDILRVWVTGAQLADMADELPTLVRLIGARPRPSVEDEDLGGDTT